MLTPSRSPFVTIGIGCSRVIAASISFKTANAAPPQLQRLSCNRVPKIQSSGAKAPLLLALSDSPPPPRRRHPDRHRLVLRVVTRRDPAFLHQHPVTDSAIGKKTGRPVNLVISSSLNASQLSFALSS